MTFSVLRRDTDSDVLPPPAVQAGDFVFFAGGLAADPHDGVPEDVRPTPRYPYHGASIERQLRRIYSEMADLLRRGGSSIDRVMKIGSFHTIPGELDTALRMRRDVFDVTSPPPSTAFFVPEVAVPTLSVTNDVIALRTGVSRDREVSHQPTGQTPLPMHDTIYKAPIFAQAARGGGFIFTAGLTAATLLNKGYYRREEFADELPYNDDFPYRLHTGRFETRLILSYLREILARYGARPQDVVKAEIILTDLRQLAGPNEAWATFFGDHRPARTIYAADVAPEGPHIEIEFIAVDPEGPYAAEVVDVPDAPERRDGNPHAVKAGPFVFLSDLMATDEKNGLAPEVEVDPGFPFDVSGAKLQAEYVMSLASRILESAGSSLRRIVRRRAMYVDLLDAGPAEDAWHAALPGEVPPTTTFRTTGPLRVPGCKVAYDLIGYAE